MVPGHPLDPRPLPLPVRGTHVVDQAGVVRVGGVAERPLEAPAKGVGDGDRQLAGEGDRVPLDTAAVRSAVAFPALTQERGTSQLGPAQQLDTGAPEVLLVLGDRRQDLVEGSLATAA